MKKEVKKLLNFYRLLLVCSKLKHIGVKVALKKLSGKANLTLDMGISTFLAILYILINPAISGSYIPVFLMLVLQVFFIFFFWSWRSEHITNDNVRWAISFLYISMLVVNVISLSLLLATLVVSSKDVSETFDRFLLTCLFVQPIGLLVGSSIKFRRLMKRYRKGQPEAVLPTQKVD